MSVKLRVHVVEARNLAAKDANGFSDPFVILEFGKAKARTTVQYKNLNPTWNEPFDFDVPYPPPLGLKLTVWDKDLVVNDFLGVCRVPLAEIPQFAPDADLAAEEPDGAWIPLQKRKDNNIISGDLRLRVGLFGDESDLARVRTSVTQVGLLSRSSSVMSSRTSSMISTRRWDNATFDMDPFCVVSYGEKVFRTRTLRHTLDPTWNEKVILPVTAHSMRFPLAFSVYDHDKFSANDYIGGCEIEVAGLVQAAAASDDVTAAVPPTDLEPTVLRLEVSGAQDPNAVTISRQPPGLTVKVGYQPMDQVRKRLWRHLLAMFDDDKNDVLSPNELTAVLDILGSTHDEELVAEGYQAIGKAPDADLTMDEAVALFEELFQVHKEDSTITSLETCPFCHVKFADVTTSSIIIHLASCVETDRGSDRLMMSGFITEAQTSRNLMTKLVQRLARGAYSVGADSANIMVISRETGRIEEEKIAAFVRIGIRLLYRGLSSAVEARRAKRMLEAMTVKQGRKYTDPASKAEIPKFIAFHGLNVDEILEPLESFQNFNEFFYRKLKPGARVLDAPEDPTVAVSMADCRLMAFSTIDLAQELWIKGRNFTLANLLQSETEAARYTGGSLVIFRLAPQDYHRFHVPVDGTLGNVTHLPGAYYTVNPMAIRSAVDVYVENRRAVTYIESREFGRVGIVLVGAMMVGSIVVTAPEGGEVHRMDELGYFAFGGSTVLVLFEPGRIALDEDLLVNADRKLETHVRVGMSIGRATRPVG
ncbi:phosphatidylserine decarboxylase [Allomyces macrogynus ATCC 38327]|uniref:Phosphatidylserine decarboxylase proenzyme 2 n=1 Tax=Allomyces macrogynus (strain ATCC 38327) TaxID=578462 RepID=A0A0L0TDI9_ALLM3|nr:phosphatidylserine decarboxylase [Allomyces macrogynus ATCC 38327]|eukprot:KNE72792.1 phosphatidylserine decarboxylase [Allomyces macrogynus ATCC 38327]